MSSGRMHLPGDIHLISNRCEEGRFFLLPTKEAVALVEYWLARAMKRYGKGIEIYAFVFLSNHFHLLCRDSFGNLAKFMGYFEGNLARALNRLIGRSKAFVWQGHYDDQIIRGERTFWNKYVYVLTNAVKSGLVKRTEEWRGANSFRAALTGKPIIGKGLNRTRHHNASRGNKKPPKKKYIETHRFDLTPPPMLAEVSQKERSKEIYKMVKQAEVHYLSRRDRKPIVGMSTVLSYKPTHKPDSVSRRPRKRFDCDTVEEVVEMVEAYRGFIVEYKKAFSAFRRAAALGYPYHGEWPEGSYPPSCDFPYSEDATPIAA